MDNSPCISAGTDSIEWQGIIYYHPDYCFYGNPRPDPVDTAPDMGASESHEGWSDIEDEPLSRLQTFSLNQNYPNPFNPTTMINYQLPMTSDVELSVYNLLGQKIATLVNESQRAGNHQVGWDASNQASGVYYYQIRAGEFQDVKKMILIR